MFVAMDDCKIEVFNKDIGDAIQSVEIGEICTEILPVGDLVMLALLEPAYIIINLKDFSKKVYQIGQKVFNLV